MKRKFSVFLAFYLICLVFIIQQFSYSEANNCYSIENIKKESTSLIDSHENYNYSEVATWGDYEENMIIETIHIGGDFAFLGGYGGFYIINISTPEQPFLISKIIFGDYITGGIVFDIHVVDNYAFLAKSDTALIVVNISDIQNPIIDSYVFNPYTSGYRRIYVDGNFLYLTSADRTKLNIFKLDDNNYPHFLTYYQQTDIDFIDAITTGDYLFLSTFNDEIEILNISDKNNLLLMSSINLSRNPIHMEIKDNYLFVGIQFDGFRVFDISNLSNPVEIIRKIPYRSEHAYAITVNDSLLYVGYGEDGMDIYDISNISKMESVGHFWGRGPVFDIQIKDNLIYSVNNLWGLSIAGKDADNDNLADYLEKLIGTDELDPDTDNDRLLDGQEYWANRNPLIWSNWGLLFGIYFIPIYAVIGGVIYLYIRKRK